MENGLQSDIKAIKTKLDEIHQDMKRYAEGSSQQHFTSILDDCRSDFSGIIIEYATEEIESGLESKMVKHCRMKDVCKALFSGLLKDNVSQIRVGKVSEESIDSARSKMKHMKEKAPYDQCSNCFSEATKLFDKQISLMRSLRVYRDKDVIIESMKDLPEKNMVDEVLEPLSNKQRLQMLKSLSVEASTFSALSSITGLRGGNLLFHLQKLLESGMIMQRHERGDYMITEKGFKALKGISELYLELISNEVETEIVRIPQPIDV